MRSKMQRKIIHELATLLTDTGINVLNDDDSWNIWRFVIIFGLFFTAGLSTSMVSITNTNNFYAFAKPSPYIATSTTILTGAFFLFHHSTVVSKILYKMDANFYTYPDEHLIQIKYPWYLQETNISIMMNITKYSILNVLFMACLPILGQLAYYGRIKTLMYPCWTPWNITTLRIELITFLLEFLQCACGLWLSYMISIFLLITVIEFSKQYWRLVAAVESLEHRTTSAGEKNKTLYDVRLRENIIHCVRHHQKLHRNFQLFKIWFSVFFSVELAISVVTFALALYVAVNAPSLSQVLNYFIVVFFIWINLFIRCLISEIFSNLNEKLAQTLIWDVAWYKANKENRRLLMIFHSLACQPLRLYGLSIFEATRVTFTKLVRITYSFFNVLNLSLKT